MPTPTKKILLIEDDNFLRSLLAKRLTTDGLHVLEAEDGEIGLKMMRADKPDLVLLDMVMPTLDGFKFLEIAKKDKKISGIPIVVVSNLGQKGEIEKSLALGALDFIIKANMTPKEISKKVLDLTSGL